MKRAPQIDLGAWVRMRPAPGREVDTTSRGRVVAIWTIRDFDGTRTTLEVRWTGPDGEPDADTVDLHPAELELIEEES